MKKLFNALCITSLGLAYHAGAIAAPIHSSRHASQFKYPKYSILGYTEDWSVLKHKPANVKGDFFDPIKYIPFNQRGDIWLSFGGQARYRFEDWYNQGFSNASTADGNFSLWRFLAHGDLHVTRYFRLFVEGKTANVSNRNLSGGRRIGDVDEAALQQGFVDINIPINQDLSFTLRPGRQEYLFGAQRLVSPLPWGNTLRTWDGITGIVNYGKWRATGFWSKFVPVVKYDFNTPAQANLFDGLYIKGSLPWAHIKTNLYWLYVNNQNAVFDRNTGHEMRHTYGIRLFGTVPNMPIKYDSEFAYQDGKLSSAGKDISAWMLTLLGTYNWNSVMLKPSLSIGYDYASGGDPTKGTLHTFKPPYPLGHAYFGYIDIVGRQNIHDLHAKIGVKPIKNVGVSLAYHQFWRANDKDALYNAGGGVVRAGNLDGSKSVGGELDLLAKYKFDRHLNFLGGYSHFFPGEFIKDAGTSDYATNFWYLQALYLI